MTRKRVHNASYLVRVQCCTTRTASVAMLPLFNNVATLAAGLALISASLIESANGQQ